MNGFMPHVALIVKDKIDTSQLDFGGTTGRQVVRSHRYTALIAKNIGPGLAWKIEVSHGNQPGNGIEVLQPPLALAVGEEVQLLRRDLTASIDLVRYTLTCEDAFGRKFQSQIGDQMKAWTQYSWTPPASS